MNKINNLFSLLICFFYLINKTFQYDSSSKYGEIRFHVFTSEKKNHSFNFNFLSELNNQTKLETICDLKEKTYVKLVVHGFLGSWNTTKRWNWVGNIKNELLRTPNADKLCVIVVDWKELSKGSKLIANYWKAIKNMQIVTDLMSKFLYLNLVKSKSIHCIGFSLGAHCCGIFSKKYFMKTDAKIARITGLDPAGPFFHSKPDNEKLNKNDADLVDIIHTSDDLGYLGNLGHMDFYFVDDKGSINIKNCDSIKESIAQEEKAILYEEESSSKTYNNIYITDIQEKEKGLNKITTDTTDNSFMGLFKKAWHQFKSFFSLAPSRIYFKARSFLACSHLASVRYFVQSINNCVFKAKFCDSLDKFLENKCYSNQSIQFPQLGYNADKSGEFYKNSQGTFYLYANTESPYCLE